MMLQTIVFLKQPGMSVIKKINFIVYYMSNAICCNTFYMMVYFLKHKYYIIIMDIKILSNVLSLLCVYTNLYLYDSYKD